MPERPLLDSFHTWTPDKIVAFVVTVGLTDGSFTGRCAQVRRRIKHVQTEVWGAGKKFRIE